MDQAEITMMENLHKNTGKTLEQWIEIVRQKNFAKHGEIIDYLKSDFGFTYGFANLVAHKSKGSDAGSVSDTQTLIDKQYAGKEHFKPVYDLLMMEIHTFGNDIEVAPKNAYVSLRRKKQFALLQPATKTRYEIGIILKGQAGSGVLEPINTANAMCTHKINISGTGDITPEVLGWLRKAYESAG
jgi:predicted transport protein